MIEILKNDPPELDISKYKNYGKSMQNFIAQCLQKDPKKRSTASKLLNHKLFRKVEVNDR